MIISQSQKETNMTTIDKIKKLNLPEDTKIHLEYSSGTDVFVHNETEVETALENTDVVTEFVSLALDHKLNLTTRWGQEPISHLRDQGLLEDYDREYWFDSYLVETINSNFYDAEIIDYSTEKYDHKRGFTTLTAELYTTVGSVLSSDHTDFPGWKVTLETQSGDLILN